MSCVHARAAVTLERDGPMLRCVCSQDDYSPLPNNVRPRVQRVLRANREYAEQQARLAQVSCGRALHRDAQPQSYPFGACLPVRPCMRCMMSHVCARVCVCV